MADDTTSKELLKAYKDEKEANYKRAQDEKANRIKNKEYSEEEIAILRDIRDNNKKINSNTRVQITKDIQAFELSKTIEQAQVEADKENQKRNAAVAKANATANERLLDKVTGLNQAQRDERAERVQNNKARQEKLDALKEQLSANGMDADKNYEVIKEQKEIDKENLKLQKKSFRESVRDKLAAARQGIKDAPKNIALAAGEGVKKSAATLFGFLKALFGPAAIFGILLGIMKFLQDPENRKKIKELFEKIKAGFIAFAEFLGDIGDAISDFKKEGPKPEEYKGLPALATGISIFFKDLSKNAKNTNTAVGKIVSSFNEAFYGKKVVGPGGAMTRTGGFMGALRSIFRPFKGIINGLKSAGAAVAKMPMLLSTLKFFTGASAVGAVAKAGGSFLKLLGKLFLPFTIVIAVFDTIKGAIEGFKEDDDATLGEKILNAITGGLKGLVNSIIGIPLDLVVSLINFVAKKFGFEEGLIPEDMKPSVLLGKAIDFLFSPIKAFLKFFGNVFEDPLGAIQTLFFDFFDPEEGIFGFITKPLMPVFDFIKKIFSFDFMGFIKKIPGVGKLIDFFTKDEAEKLQEIEDDIKKAEAKIAEARDRMERSEGGENVYYGDEEYKRAQDAKKIAKLEEEIAKAKAKELEILGGNAPVIVNQDNSTNDNSTNSNSATVTGKSTTPLAYSDAYYAAGI